MLIFEGDGSSEEVGAEMEMGKKRKVLRRGRFLGGMGLLVSR